MSERAKRWRTWAGVSVAVALLLFCRWEAWEYRDVDGNLVGSSSQFVLFGFGELAPPAIPEMAVTESHRSVGILTGFSRERTLPRPAVEAKAEPGEQ